MGWEDRLLMVTAFCMALVSVVLAFYLGVNAVNFLVDLIFD